MIEKPAEQYVGKFLFFYTKLLPKAPFFIDPVGVKVKAVKGHRQMFIEAAEPGQHIDIEFTRVGDHIAVVCDTYEAYLQAKQAIMTHKGQIEMLNGTLKTNLDEINRPQPARVRVRSLQPVAMT